MPVSKDMHILQVLPGSGFGYPVKANSRIYGRSLIGVNADGFAEPLNASSVAFVGIAINGVNSQGLQDGDETVNVERDSRLVPMEVDPADIGKAVYVKDDDITSFTTTNEGKRIGILTGTTVTNSGRFAVINLAL